MLASAEIRIEDIDRQAILYRMPSGTLVWYARMGQETEIVRCKERMVIDRALAELQRHMGPEFSVSLRAVADISGVELCYLPRHAEFEDREQRITAQIKRLG